MNTHPQGAMGILPDARPLRLLRASNSPRPCGKRVRGLFSLIFKSGAGNSLLGRRAEALAILPNRAFPAGSLARGMGKPNRLKEASVRVAARHVMAGLLMTAAAYAAPPAPGSEDAELRAPFVDWIKSQHTASGAWCCDMSDGRPLFEGEWRTVGERYEIHITRRHWTDAPEGGVWITVPPQKVTGHSPIYCFAPVGGF